MHPFFSVTLCFSLFATVATAQNVGIGVANPTKGKLEIAGALGNNTTVLTIGSDGAGISLQRNWPTVGFNQYRDVNNVQRFIGNGHAGTIYMSAVDGSFVFQQLGTGTANGLIGNASVPLYISGLGAVNITKRLQLGADALLSHERSGINNNMLPMTVGSVSSDGSKLRGTPNFTVQYSSFNDVYVIESTLPVTNTYILVTPRPFYLEPFYATVQTASINYYLVSIWNKSGEKAKEGFDFVIFSL